jgi:hypothetical protein
MNRRGIAGDRGRRLFAGGVLPALGVFLVIAGVAMAVHVGPWHLAGSGAVWAAAVAGLAVASSRRAQT